ncbi:MAG: peptidase S10 [Chloracidobacterium sp.]|nr:peptidase S10 [Chloracidobacterium sp.]
MRIFAFAFFLSAISLFAQAQPPSRPTPTPGSSPSPRAAESPRPSPTPPVLPTDEPPVVTKHSARVGGRQLNYTVTTGFLPIRNAVSGETEGRMFYMAYTLDGVSDKRSRPLMFSFNGGPGSASVWLHLGALGPKRVKMLDDGMMPPPPYELVENDHSWLDLTDLVFVDPVGTGYSRAAKPEFASRFFSVNGDISANGEFIRLFLGRNERWASPVYLVGESYGTTRVAGLANHLFERGVGLNGIALVSMVTNFQSIRFADNNDMPLVLYFPSYVATAWYHKALPPEMQSKRLTDLLREAEKFAAEEYAPALLRIDRLSDAERNSLLDKFSSFTGLSKTFVDNQNFRVELGEFNKELLRNRKRTTGRLDSRFLGYDRDSGGDSPEFDPSMTAIRTPYTATFNDYVRRELGFKSDLEYYILGGGITTPWNWNTNNAYADTTGALSSAMRKNPYMKVFLASGYYDMATPYFAADYTISSMNLNPDLRRNISTAYYEAGHMMYIEKNSLMKLKNDISAFMRASATR